MHSHATIYIIILLYFSTSNGHPQDSSVLSAYIMHERLFTCLAKKNRHNNSLAIVFINNTSMKSCVCRCIGKLYTMSKVKVKYRVSVMISYIH